MGRSGVMGHHSRGAFPLLLCCLTLACAISTKARAQDTPQSPDQPTQNPPANTKTDPSENTPSNADENKDSNPRSDIEKPIELPEIAAQETKKLGEETLVKVREWEIGWVTGPFAGRQRPLVPLTDRQRQNVYLEQTFSFPSAYLKRMFVAGVNQWRDSPSGWGQGWGAYGKRFASSEGQYLVANSLAALGDAKLKYEPMYDQCQCSGFWPRTRHAILRNFITYNSTESELRPQWALYGGAFGGGLISTLWKPRPQNALANAGYGMLGQAAYGSLLNVFIEFAGDINRKLGAKNGDLPAHFRENP